MPDVETIACSIADTLEATDDPRSELIALGMVVSGLICQTNPDERAELVDTFCRLVRASVADTLN